MTAAETFANQPQTTVTAGGTTAPAGGTTESWTVSSSSSFPAASTGVTQFHVADTASGKTGEIILVTNVSGTTWSVTRGAEGTTPVAHSTGFGIVQVVTAGALGSFVQTPGGSLAVSGTPSAGQVLTATSGTAADWAAPAAGDPAAWFRPESYSGIGDGILVGDGAMTSSSHTLTCSTSTPFAPGDASGGGKVILVTGAGAAGADLVTNISGYTSSSQVTLTTAASTTASGAGVIFGTDNTTPIKNARSAAITYAEADAAHSAYVVYQPGKVYCVGGAATVGTGTGTGNAIFLDPAITGDHPKITFGDLCPNADASGLPHWLQTAPQTAGATIAVLRLDGTNDGTYGPASVFGGPFDGYGGNESGGGLFTNMCRTVDGITVLVPFNSTFSGWDFWGYAEAAVGSASCFSMGIVPASGPWRQYDAGAITNTWTYGLRMPSTGNNARCDVQYFSCEGLCYGFGPSEHTRFDSVRAINCIGGFAPYSGNGVSMVHGVDGSLATIEACSQAIIGIDGQVKLNIATVDAESNGNIIFDTGPHLEGYIAIRGGGSGYGLSGVYSSGTTSRAVKVINLDQPPGAVSSPQAPPATTVNWVNGYYRDAWITVALDGGHTFTSLSVDSVAQPNAAGAGTYSFMLPSFHFYTPVYSAGTLSHTVTLL